MATYNLVNGRVKVQVESIMGTKPGNGWVYQAPGTGNNPGAEGAHYYYKSQTDQGSNNKAPTTGRFTFDVNVQQAGQYSILLRASRDNAQPGDSRNDIWIKVDGGTSSVVPDGTPQLSSGGSGFVKYKSAPPANKWVWAKTFSTPDEDDNNAPSNVVFTKGIHTITFAPRSTGYHIDSVQVIKVGLPINGAALDAAAFALPAEDVVGVAGSALTIDIASGSDDFESHKASASADLEFGKGGQTVGLRFDASDIDTDAEIESAYFVFQAAETSKGKAHFEIEVEASADARTYTKADAPDDRTYLADDIDWNPGQWQQGKVYKSADVSDLIRAVLEEGGAEALEALAFRISGSGTRVAEAFEGDGDGPSLVVNYA